MNDRITPRLGLRIALGLLALTLVVFAATLYGMNGEAGKQTAACAADAALAARLDPLSHGETAAFSIDKRPRLAPDLVFKGPEGAPVTLASLKGRVVLLNLWATWCAPCRKEMPALDALQAKLGSPEFEVVAINVDTSRLERPAQFLAEAGVTHLVRYADPSGDVLSTLKQDGRLLGLPTTVLVGKSGCALGVLAGPAAWDSADGLALARAAIGG